jgi:hypothetical protein
LPAPLLTAEQAVSVLSLAAAHGVTGTVLAHLRRGLPGGGGPPLVALGAEVELAPILDRAVRDWFGTVGACLGMRAEGRRIVDALLAASVPALPIKGADFADRLYPEPAQRAFRDIDVLVGRSDFARAEQIVEQLGYRPLGAPLKHAEGYGQSGWQSSTAERWSVEVHWNLINSPAQRRHSSLQLEDLQLQPPRPSTATTALASPASLLLIAAMHAAHSHRFDRLQHLCDVRQICRGAAGPLDDDWLKAAAVRCGAAASLSAALDVTARVLGSVSARRVQQRLGLTGGRLTWRLFADSQSLLYPQRTVSRFRRVALREWLKRAG